jgi:hypothetical protein
LFVQALDEADADEKVEDVTAADGFYKPRV